MSINAVLALAVTLLASSATAQSGPGASPPPRTVVELDLALGTTPKRLVGTPGQIELRLRNALPTSPYRVWMTIEGRTGPPINVMRGGPFRDPPRPAGCSGLAAQEAALYRIRDEAEIAVAADALERSPEGCSVRAIILEVSLLWTRTGVTNMKLEDGRDVGLRVERLDAQGQVAKTWSTTLVGRVPDRGWKLKTEQEWVIHEVRLNLARLVAAADDKPLPTEIGARAGFAPSPHVWAPEAYRQEFTAAGRPDGQSPPPVHSILDALQDLRASTLESENDRVSLRLTEDIRDAGAHEEAAFLLGVFALREAAGQFSDTRPALSRMTAHLAFARALRAEAAPGPTGRFAAVLLSTLVGRQREALDILGAIDVDAKSPDAVWRRCLQTENDLDWRRLSPSGPLVERIVLFRALSRTASPHKAVVIFGSDSLEPLPDWGRIAFEHGAAVEVGNLFLAQRLPLELQELVSVRGVPADDLGKVLAERWGPTVRVAAGHIAVRVLDSGAWSEFASRHLLAAAASVEAHLQTTLGLPDDAKSAGETIEGGLRYLPLYPFVRVLRKGKPDCAALAPSLLAVHERVPAATWYSARVRCQGTDAISLPSIWFAPTFPRGTAFDAEKRLQSGEGLGVDLVEAERLRRLAPFSRLVVDVWLERRFPPPQQATIEQRLEAFGPAADYRADVLQGIFDRARDDPKARMLVARRLCALDTAQCVTLAWLLAGSGDADGAAAAYRRAFGGGMDEVAASSHSKWLVDYELGRGHVDEAKELAERMAGTGSGSGFDIMGWFCERTGDLVGAERAYRAIATRYQDTRSLDGFYVRRGIAGDSAYKEQAKDARSRLFPFGLERFDPAKAGEQALGVQIAEPDELLTRAGLIAGDTIVGLDGYRIRDGDQYKTIRQLRTAGNLDLSVWRFAAKTLVSVSYPTVGMRGINAPLRSQWTASQQLAMTGSAAGLQPGPENLVEQATKGAPTGTDAALQIVAAIATQRAKASTLVPILRTAPDDVKLAVLKRAWQIRREDLAEIAPEFVLLAERAPAALRVRALGVIGMVADQYPAGLALLVKTLADSDPVARAAAAAAISGAGSKARDALPRLREMAKGDPDPRTRASAATSVNTIEVMLKSASPGKPPH